MYDHDHLSISMANIQANAEANILIGCASALGGFPLTLGGLPFTLGGLPFTLGGFPFTLGGLPFTLEGLPFTLGVAGSYFFLLILSLSLISPKILHRSKKKI